MIAKQFVLSLHTRSRVFGREREREGEKGEGGSVSFRSKGRRICSVGSHMIPHPDIEIKNCRQHWYGRVFDFMGNTSGQKSRARKMETTKYNTAKLNQARAKTSAPMHQNMARREHRSSSVMKNQKSVSSVRIKRVLPA